MGQVHHCQVDHRTRLAVARARQERTRGGLARVRGVGVGWRGWGGTGCFVCMLLHSIGFMLFIAKVRAEPWARTPET